jgi:UDP-N-acetylmuramate--alanine ligase
MRRSRPWSSCAIVVWDRPELLALARSSARAQAPGATTGGKSAEAHAAVALVPYEQPDAIVEGEGSRFHWRGVEVRLAVPGAHNALNAVAALEAARLAGGDAALAVGGLRCFRGAWRRFQLVGRSARGALLYDDYAHHPTEVAATLEAARTLNPRRLVAVFQPHLYSRSGLLAPEFGRALALADVVAVLDVYPARERAQEHPGVNGLIIAEATADAAEGRPVYWLPTFADAEPVLAGLLGEGDLCILMGAGDIDALGHRLVGA